MRLLALNEVDRMLALSIVWAAAVSEPIRGIDDLRNRSVRRLLKPASESRGPLLRPAIVQHHQRLWRGRGHVALRGAADAVGEIERRHYLIWIIAQALEVNAAAGGVAIDR